MLLVCPSCASSYNISEAKLGKGRTVRCKQCQACWYAAPPPPPDAFDAAVAPILAVADEAANEAAAARAAAEASPEPEPADRTEAEPALAEETAFAAPEEERIERAVADIDGEVVASSARVAAPEPEIEARPLPPRESASLAARLFGALWRLAMRIAPPRRALWKIGLPATSSPVFQTVPPAARARPAPRRAARRRSPAAAIAPYAAFALSCAAVLALAARGPIMAAAPATARLYEALGLADESGPVAVVSLRSEIGAGEGGEVLLVEGELASRAHAPVNVPAIRVVVRDARGVELYAWAAQSLKLTLEPGERTLFRARLAAPPPDGQTVQVKLQADHGDARPPRTS